MTGHEIARYYPNGSFMERYAVHVESDPDGEWQAAIEACDYGETVVRFFNDVEVDRFRLDPLC